MARKSKAWKVTAYPTWRSPASPCFSTLPLELSNIRPQRDPKEVYFDYFYPWVRTAHANLVNVLQMESQWEAPLPMDLPDDPMCQSFEGFVVDASPCQEPALWLLAAVTLSLSTHILPESATFSLISEVFDRSNDMVDEGRYSTSNLAGRLKADIGYWQYFARSRGLHHNLTGETFQLESLPVDEREHLLYLLFDVIGRKKNVDENFWRCSLFTVATVPVTRVIVTSLLSMGVKVLSRAADSRLSFAEDLRLETKLWNSLLSSSSVLLWKEKNSLKAGSNR